MILFHEVSRFAKRSLLFNVITMTLVMASGGATLWIQWIYSNPDSMLDDGRTCDRFTNPGCDVNFYVCLRNAASSGTGNDKCSIYQYSSPEYDNAVFLNISGANALKVPIPAPVPNFYSLEMDIYDKDFVPAYEFVGSFLAENFEVVPGSSFQKIPMTNKNAKTSNKRLRIDLEMKLVCNQNYYGKHCSRECIADIQKYTCNEDGFRVCKKGFTGKDCEHEDSCFYEPCAPHATCQNREDGQGRHCICDGKEAPQCYPGYDPCSSMPCKNHGTCHPTGQYGESFRCECSDEWAGHRCTERRSACSEALEELKERQETWAVNSSVELDKLTLCLNGGKCMEYSDRFAYQCLCSDGWDGPRCELPVAKMATSTHLMYILIVLLGAFLALLVIVLTVGLILRRRKLKWLNSPYVHRNGGIVYYHSDRDSTGTVASFLHSPPHLSNALYGSPVLTEKSYLASPNPPHGLSANRYRTDVYDECDPLGLENKTGVYGAAFDNEALISTDNPRSSAIGTGSDETAPPLPERPRELSQYSLQQSSIMSIPSPENSTMSSWDNFKPRSESRKPIVYRPLSPTFTPTTIEKNPRSSLAE